MGCCGDPIDKPIPEEGNRIHPFTAGGPVVQQPSAQSAPQWQEKSPMTSITTPPPVLQYGQPGWDEKAAFNPYATSGSSTYRESTYMPTSSSPPPSAYTQSPPLIQPTAMYAPNGRMTVTGRRTTSPNAPAFAPPSDEGKLSVSIDFGT